jgi:hypothetical protein
MLSLVRGVVATLLIAAGLLALAVGLPAGWLDRHLLESDEYVERITPLIAEPAVQAQVAANLAGAVHERVDVPTRLSPLVDRAAEQVVATDAFAAVWGEAVRLSHEHAMAAVRDEGRGLALDGGTLSIELAPLLDAFVPRLDQVGVPGVGVLDRVGGSIELVSSPRLGTASWGVRFVDEWGFRLIPIGAVLMGLGVLVARRTGFALFVAGAGTLAVAALMRGGWSLLTRGDRFVGEGGPEVTRLALLAVFEGGQGWIVWTAVAGGAAVVLGLLSGLRGRNR